MNKPNEKAIAEIQLDTDRVLVTKWTFPPNSETGWHRHNYDYVVVPLSDGSLSLESSEGEQKGELKTGGSYNRKAGVEHNVINKTDREVSFIEIELK
ncbi:MAG: cupin domain-containing protein [Pseudomonadota bacterium]|nr:cupin domain-containing protein [Pseudomonadota bacterium]